MQRKVYCSTIEVGVAKTGNQYLKVNASFKENGISKQVQYYLWDNVDMFKGIFDSGIRIFNVEVTDDPSFPKIQSFVTSAGDLSEFFDFIYASDDEARSKFLVLFKSFSDDSIYSALISKIMGMVAPSGNKILEDFIVFPGAKAFHHNYRYGLLQHTLEVVQFVRSISQTLPFKDKLDIQLVTCGAFLHDVGKVFEYRFDGVNAADYDTSYQGQLYLGSHLYKGAELVALAYDQLKASSELSTKYSIGQKTDIQVEHLKHIILSHHLMRDWGAVPKQPQTLEAYLVFLADYFSAAFGKFNSLDWSQVSINEIVQATSKSDTFFGFTPLMNQLEE